MQMKSARSGKIRKSSPLQSIPPLEFKPSSYHSNMSFGPSSYEASTSYASASSVSYPSLPYTSSSSYGTYSPSSSYQGLIPYSTTSLHVQPLEHHVSRSETLFYLQKQYQANIQQKHDFTLHHKKGNKTILISMFSTCCSLFFLESNHTTFCRISW